MSLVTVPSSLKVTRSSFRMRSSVAMSESFATFQQQVYDWGGTRWEGEVTLKPYTYDDSADMRAFLMALRGKTNRFLYGDPDYLVHGARGTASGTPLVNGAAQTGNTIDIDGFTPSDTGVVRAGDYLQLGSGASAELYGILEDADANGSGEATITLNRNLLSSPADNAAVVINNAQGVFRLSENIAEWSANQSSVTEITISFVEAL